MGYIVHWTYDCTATLKALRIVLIAMLGFSGLIGCQTTPTLPGNPVSSGEFYDVIIHHYTATLPPLLEARDAEKLYSSLSIARDRWKHEDEDGQIFDYSSRIQNAKERFNDSLRRGIRWDISSQVEKVTMTDATHGAVQWILINNWETENRTNSGRNRTRGLTHWEKIEGQWRVVATKILSRSF